MTSAESIVYGSHGYGYSAQYNPIAQQPSNKKCCSTKAKIIAAGLTIVSLALGGGLFYYFSTRSKINCPTT